MAAVAALALIDPGAHVGQAYVLTGPEALDFHRVASLLSAELGRPVDYRPSSLLTRRRELRRHGGPAGLATVQLVIDLTTRLGLAARVTDTVERLLRRPATPLAVYVHDRRDRWDPRAGGDRPAAAE